MVRKSKHHQPSLFDEETPLVKPCPAHRIELAGLVEALLREIAATLVNVRRGESIDERRRQPKLVRSAGASPAQVELSKRPGSECCVRRRRRRTRSVHSGCVGCGSEPRNDAIAGAETVLIVERNMGDAVMRGIVVPPGSRATSRAKGSRRKLGYLVTDQPAVCRLGPHREGEEP